MPNVNNPCKYGVSYWFVREGNLLKNEKNGVRILFFHAYEMKLCEQNERPQIQ